MVEVDVFKEKPFALSFDGVHIVSVGLMQFVLISFKMV
jgi:hypothetical protein